MPPEDTEKMEIFIMPQCRYDWKPVDNHARTTRIAQSWIEGKRQLTAAPVVVMHRSLGAVADRCDIWPLRGLLFSGIHAQ